ncbi:hypothetical protein [Acidovorax sp. 62]|uniref:hypothetical protein n=1 Tax=Acidovorax sp. 62 TaxID=2035203 RepID=UPI001178812A|nr:hypothetical protein [Acidovorax sp. 62]
MPKLLAQRLKSIPHSAARSVKTFAPDLAKFITATSYELMGVKSLPAQARGGESLILPKMSVGADDALLEVTLQLDGTRAEFGRYLYSKLYYTTHPQAQFSEDAVVCFEVRERFSPQRLQIALPDAALRAARASGCLRVRIDGLPYSQGTWQLIEMRLGAVENQAQRLGGL